MAEDPTMRRLKELDAALPDPEISPALALAIFEESADAKVIVDLEDRRIRYVNKMAEFVFGYHKSEMIGKSVEMLVPEEYRGYHQKHTEEYAAQPRIRAMSHGRLLQGRHKSGKLINAHIMLTPVSVPEGQFALATIQPYTKTLTVLKLGDE